MVGSVDRIPQLEAMRLGVDYRFPVHIRAFSVLLRPLSIKETVDVTNRVIEQINHMGASIVAQNHLMEQTLLAIETLTMASTSDVGTNDPRLTALVLEKFTPDELNLIFKEYVAGCDKVNPSLDRMNAEEIDALVEKVKKNPDYQVNPLLPLIEQSHWRLANIALHLLTKGD